MNEEPDTKRTKYDPISFIKDNLARKGLFADQSLLENLINEYQDIKTIISLLSGEDSHDIMDKTTDKKSVEEESSDEELSGSFLYEEVLQIKKILPNVSKKNIYKALEIFFESKDRVQITIDHLIGQEAKNSIAGKAESSNLAKLASLFPEIHEQTVKKVMKEFDDKDQNFIENCSVELLKIQTSSETKGNEIVNDTDPSLIPSTSKDNSIPDTDKSVDGKVDEHLKKLQKDVDKIRKLFVDCDPNYLFEELENLGDNPNRVEFLSNNMFDKKDYPKLSDRLKREKIENRHYNLTQKNLDDIENFLRAFPDPKSVFRDQKKTPSASYKIHVDSIIPNYFLWMNIDTINEATKRHTYRLVDIFQELNEIEIKYCKVPNMNKNIVSRGLFDKKPKEKVKLPDSVDEYFYNELLYAKNEKEILKYIDLRKTVKESRRNEARENNWLNTCLCCYDDSVLEEDSFICDQGCKFCDDCIRRAGEHALSAAEWRIDCMAGCGGYVPLNSIQYTLKPSTINALFVRMQQEEIKAAGLPDLVQCPFCNFAVIISNEDDKILNCLNPECLKSSCVKCKELEHTPMSCEEIEKADETRIRSMIELKMTEAMIRTCPNCNKRFFKESGCNKMTCVCGQSMCYICKEAITGYEHFNANGNCSTITNPDQIHEREMREALKSARKEFEEKHPGKELTLKYDPEEHIKDINPNDAGHLVPGPLFERLRMGHPDPVVRPLIPPRFPIDPPLPAEERPAFAPLEFGIERLLPLPRNMVPPLIDNGEYADYEEF